MIHGPSLWSEDDVLRQINDPDRETIYTEWPKRFGEPFDQKNAVATEDGGDCTFYRMPNGHVVCRACDGDYLYAPAPVHECDQLESCQPPFEKDQSRHDARCRYNDLKCPDCGGVGSLDTGGVQPWGEGINEGCPSCKGSGVYRPSEAFNG